MSSFQRLWLAGGVASVFPEFAGEVVLVFVSKFRRRLFHTGSIHQLFHRAPHSQGDHPIVPTQTELTFDMPLRRRRGGNERQHHRESRPGANR